MSRGRLVALLILLTSLILAGLILTDAGAFLRGPAPETSEWYWPYRLTPLVRWWPALAAATGMVVLSVWWSRRPERSRVALSLLAFLSLALQLGLVYAARPNIGAELVDRTLSKASSGYLATAGEIDDLGAVLRDFPALMPTFDNEHVQTHPPGLVAAHWLTDRGFRRTPLLANALARPSTFWRCTDLWLLARPASTAAALTVWSWIPLLLAAASVFPAYAIGRRWYDSTGRRMAALLVAAIPALLVFAPSSDQLFAFLALLSLWLLLAGLDERRGLLVFLSGVAVSLATFLSAGNAVWAALLLVVLGWRASRPPRPAASGMLVGLALFGGGALSLWLLYWLGWGVAPWEVVTVALERHESLVTSLRRYEWWLGYNPLDFALYAGLGVAAGLLWQAWRALRNRAERHRDPGVLALSLSLTLVALNVAGTTRGEVGRLWLPFMALAAVVAGGILARRLATELDRTLILLAQFALVLSIGFAWRSFYAVILPVSEPEMAATDQPWVDAAVTFTSPDGRRLQVLGYISQDSVVQGETLPVTLLWEGSGPTLRPYTVFVQLLDSDGNVVAQQDDWPVGGQWPTTCWAGQSPVVDRRDIALGESVAPGIYRVVAGLYDASGGQRLLTDEGADFVSLPAVDVLPAD